VQSALYDDVAHTIPLAGDGLVRSAAWTLGGLAVASDCAGRILEDDPQQAGLQFVSRFADAPEGCVLGGKRARWADLDHDADLDVLFVAADGVSWIQRDVNGWHDEGTIVAAGGAALADVALLDADADHDLDLVVAFADGPARRYLQDQGAFVLDETFTSAGSGFTTVEACDVAGDAAREVVLAGPTGSEIVGVAPGLPAASAIACGILNGNTSKDEIALLGADGHVRVVTGAGTVRWDSAVDLDPPLTVAGTGIAVGSADFDPIVSDIVIAVSGATGAVPFVVLSPAGDTFTVDSAPDPAPDSEARGVQLTDPGGY